MTSEERHKAWEELDPALKENCSFNLFKGLMDCNGQDVPRTIEQIKNRQSAIDLLDRIRERSQLEQSCVHI